MTLLQICQELEASRLGELVTLSQWGFPILVAMHLLGLGLSAGLIMWMDLRLLGWVLADYPVGTLYRRLAPWALTGFALMVVSGVVLFVGYATRGAPGPSRFSMRTIAWE